MTFTKVTNTGIGSTGTVLLQNLDVIGIVTAGFGVSTVDVFTTGVSTFSGNVTFGGDVSIGGTLTYEDVTNVDSVGLITARGGVFISAGSSIGIGSATPTANIEVHSSNTTLGILSSTNSGANLSIFDTNSESKLRTVGGRLHIAADDGDAVDDSEIRFLVDSNVVARISAGSTLSLGSGTDNQISTPADDTLALRTAGSERLRVSSDGKILVNHTTGRYDDLLQIEGTGGESTIAIVRNSNNGSGAGLFLGKSRTNSVGGNTIVNSGDKMGVISFGGADGTDLASLGAQITGEVDGTPGADDMPGRIVFKTTSDGSNSTTERLRIGSAGQIGIAGANYGTDNQALTSQGSSSAVEWRGINTPAWDSYQNPAHNVATNTWTLITNLVEEFDSDGAFASSAFTVPTGGAGTYFIYGYVTIDDVQAADYVICGISVNGGEPGLGRRGFMNTGGSSNVRIGSVVNCMITLAVGDVVRLSAFHNEGSTEPTEPYYTRFGGYRMSI